MIDVIDLRKNFGGLEVLKGITTAIREGEKVVVVGPSGSGKARSCAASTASRSTSGSIIFEGVDIADMKVDINIHRRHIGMVFQQFNLFSNKTVLGNIMLRSI